MLVQQRRDHRHLDLLLNRIIALLRADVRDEEDILLPRLQQDADAKTLRRAGLAWLLVRRTARPARTPSSPTARPAIPLPRCRSRRWTAPATASTSSPAAPRPGSRAAARG